MFAARKIFLLLLCTQWPHVWADDAHSEYTIRRSPTMAVFYSVEQGGRSVREIIDTVVIADPDAKPSRTVIAGSPKAKQQPQPKSVPRATATVLVVQKHHDSFAELRCERYGFYFTSSGECIVPAGFYRYELKADKPEPMPNKSLTTPKPLNPVFTGRR